MHDQRSGDPVVPRALGIEDARQALDDAQVHLVCARSMTGVRRREALQVAAMRAAWAGRLLSDLAAQQPTTAPAP